MNECTQAMKVLEAAETAKTRKRLGLDKDEEEAAKAAKAAAEAEARAANPDSTPKDATELAIQRLNAQTLQKAAEEAASQDAANAEHGERMEQDTRERAREREQETAAAGGGSQPGSAASSRPGTVPAPADEKEKELLPPPAVEVLEWMVDHPKQLVQSPLLTGEITCCVLRAGGLNQVSQRHSAKRWEGE